MSLWAPPARLYWPRRLPDGRAVGVIASVFTHASGGSVMIDGCSGGERRPLRRPEGGGRRPRRRRGARRTRSTATPRSSRRTTASSVVDSHSKPSAARVDRRAAPGDHAEARPLRGQHAFPLGPLARQRGLPRRLRPRRGDHERHHPRGHASGRASSASRTTCARCRPRSTGCARSSPPRTSADQRAELGSSLRQAEQYFAEVRALGPPSRPSPSSADDADLPARPRDPSPLPRARPHRGRRVRLSPEGEGRGDRGRGDRLDPVHGRRLSAGLAGDAPPARASSTSTA